MERYPLPAGHEVGPLDELFDDATVKLLARHEERDPEEFWTEVEGLVGHLVTTTWSSTGALVEISAAGVTKASTLALLCDELGVARRRGGRLRGHAQRPGDARVGRHVVRHGQRAPQRARAGRAHGRPPTRRTASRRCSRSLFDL